jgi:hypothetical protein
MAQFYKVQLYHGLTMGGVVDTVAELRDLTGHDEAIVTEPGDDTPAERVSALIAALTLRIGHCEHPSRERLLQLTVGDRERLLLAVSARLLGAEADLLTSCPGCGNLAEVPVRFADLISIEPMTPPDRIELASPAGGWIARCRPITGADLEKAARSGAHGVRDLLVGCLLDLSDPAGQLRSPDSLPSECVADLADALAALDPAAECSAEIECPFCAGKIEALVDGFTVMRTAFGGPQRLYEDVYHMARAYHWSEADILALPLRRRRHYLAIADGAGVGP